MRAYRAVLIGVVGLLVAACGGGATDTPIPTNTPATKQEAKPTAATQVEDGSPTPGATSTVAPAPPVVKATAIPVTGRVGELDVNIGLMIHYSRTVPVGTTVTWTNVSKREHTTTSGVPGALAGLWDSGKLRHPSEDDGRPGETFSYTFNEIGVFSYFCVIHPDQMQARITVTATGEPTPTAVPTPTPTPLPVAEQKEVTLLIKNFTHLNATIKVGTTVTWHNPTTGVDLHTSTSGVARTKDAAKMWKSPALGRLSPQSPTPGGDLPSWSFTFTEVGIFPYFCEFHPGIMIAQITVVE